MQRKHQVYIMQLKQMRKGCHDPPMTMGRPDAFDSETSTLANSLVFSAPFAASLKQSGDSHDASLCAY